jgi:hypothetical protein
VQPLVVEALAEKLAEEGKIVVVVVCMGVAIQTAKAEAGAQFVSFGPARPVVSPQLTQGIYK